MTMYECQWLLPGVESETWLKCEIVLYLPATSVPCFKRQMEMTERYF